MAGKTILQITAKKKMLMVTLVLCPPTFATIPPIKSIILTNKKGNSPPAWYAPITKTTAGINKQGKIKAGNKNQAILYFFCPSQKS